MSVPSLELRADAPGPSQAQIVRLLAPLYLGALMSWFLFGVSSVQLYLYHITPYKDPKFVQATVYIIFVLDILQSVIGLDLGWGVLVVGWGQVPKLIFPAWTFKSLPTVSGIVAAWVQIFYAWRIRKLSQWVILPAIIVMLALGQCAAAFSTTIGAAPFTNVAQLHTITPRISTWLGGSALVDFIISTAMIYLLFMKRKAVHFRHSELRINRLIRLSVETGLATTATAMCDLIVFVAAINANYHAFFTLLMCKVYSNALMTTLNSREYNSQSAATTTVQLIDMTSQLNAARDTSTRDRSTAIVHVSSETEVFGATTALDGEKPRVLGAEGSQPSLASFGGVGKD